MPKETPELPVSEQEVQIQAPPLSAEASGEGGSFFDKLKNQRVGILIGILIVFGIAGIAFGGYKLWLVYLSKQPQCLIPEGCPPKKEFVSPATPTPLPSEVPVTASSPTPPIKTINYKLIKGWERYDNTSGGYSIQYDPTEYKVVDEDRVVLALSITDVLDFPCSTSKCQDSIGVTIYSNYNGGSRRQWLEEVVGLARAERYLEEVVVGSNNALIAMDDHRTYIAMPLENNKMLSISIGRAFYSPTQKKPVNLEFVYQFLSGFKFLE